MEHIQCVSTYHLRVVPVPCMQPVGNWFHQHLHMLCTTAQSWHRPETQPFLSCTPVGRWRSSTGQLHQWEQWRFQWEGCICDRQKQNTCYWARTLTTMGEFCLSIKNGDFDFLKFVPMWLVFQTAKLQNRTKDYGTMQLMACRSKTIWSMHNEQRQRDMTDILQKTIHAHNSEISDTFVVNTQSLLWVLDHRDIHCIYFCLSHTLPQVTFTKLLTCLHLCIFSGVTLF